MTDIATLHRRAAHDFCATAATIEDAQWDRPTPCADWNVRELVNHVVAEDLWTPLLLAGHTIEQVGDRFDGDVLGDDPAGTCERATTRAIDAVMAADSLERTVHLSFGDAPAELYVWQLFTDHLIHTWDLTAALEAGDRLDPKLVEACAHWFVEHEEDYRQAGVIGPRPEGGKHADPQTRLLQAFGRDPSAWS